ncbi:MAG TPA: RDD family protein [Verrucomicrobiae bacterium]|nr:RDD family protein [Verrucomicrobiae bacterium]
MNSELKIRTPEGIVFAQPLASPVIRFLAWSIDAAAIGVLMMIVGIAGNGLQLFDAGLAGAVLTVAYFVLSVGYGIVLEWLWRGQTIGKRVLRLRVVDAEGLRLQFDQVVTRNLLRFVDILPALYLVGGIACWFNRKCQRLGDIAANTNVIRVPQRVEPDLDQLLTDKFNSLREHPHLTARLRQAVGPAEARIAMQALLRRDDFEGTARVELFSELAAHFRAKVEFPPECTDGVPDEQYIRNVVDILFRTSRSERKDARGRTPV